MPSESPQVSHAATILGVPDLEKGLAFYRDILGFKVAFLWGDPVDYAVLNREDKVSIHLSLNPPREAPPHTILYIFVHDVDRMYAELRESGLNLPYQPETQPYGMREFDVQDPFGYRISFGTFVESAS